MTQRVEHVISAQGNDLSDLVNRYAEAEQCPPVGLLAGLISESNLNEHAERIGSWPDWSEGLGQQTALYASVGDHTATMANLKVVRDYYWQPENAIAEAARQYGAYYRQYQDHFEAWSRYNGGTGMAWADSPKQANIRRGWNVAQLYLAPDEEPPAMTDEGLVSLLGYLQGDVADALEQAIKDAKTARTKAERDAKLDAALAAVSTLRRGG